MNAPEAVIKSAGRTDLQKTLDLGCTAPVPAKRRLPPAVLLDEIVRHQMVRGTSCCDDPPDQLLGRPAGQGNTPADGRPQPVATGNAARLVPIVQRTAPRR
jgi:hypothetical protein